MKPEEGKVTLTILLSGGSIEVEEYDKEVFSPPALWEYLNGGDEIYNFVVCEHSEEMDLELTEAGQVDIRLKFQAWVDFDTDRDEITWREYSIPYIDGKLVSREEIARA